VYNGLIYLDNNATTKLDDRVLQSMLPYLTDHYANASSSHAFGVEINRAVEHARKQVADLICCEPHEVLLTSGATESINIALKGLAFQTSGSKNKFITVVSEHMAVLDTFAYLEQIGFEVIYLKVDEHGLFDLGVLQNEIDNQTIGVCVMLANNETGTIQPIKLIADICNQNDVFFICDATQAVGKIPVNVNEFGVDLLVFSAHKFHGPKGAGALFVRKGVQLSSVIHRGTLNVPNIIGFARACDIAKTEMDVNADYIGSVKDYLETSLLGISGTKLNGHPIQRIYNVVNVCFPGIDANTLIKSLPNIAVSNGSACRAAVFEPSHVLTAMGLSRSEAYGSIRFSLSKFNTMEEIINVLKILRYYLK